MQYPLACILFVPTSPAPIAGLFFDQGAKPRMVDEPLQVMVDGTSIIVTILGTDFSVTYQKQLGRCRLPC